MSDKITLKESAVQHVTCQRCGMLYDYDHVGSAEAESTTLTGKDLLLSEQRAKAEAKLDRIFERGLIVPCPKCKAITPAMRKQLLRVALRDLAMLAGALTLAGFIMLAALNSGALAWGLGIFSLVAAAAFALRLLFLPFGSYNDATGRPAGELAPASADDIFNALRMPGGDGRRRD